MNIIKNLLLILFLLLSTINFAQTTADINCASELKTIDTEIKSQSTVSYKIIFSQKLYTEKSFEFSEAIIVITDIDDNLNLDETIEAIVAIGVKNKLSKILAFKTCKAVEFYFNQNRLNSSQTDYLDKNLLPKVEIDLNKSLSKKERKKNKRKRDLIELVSNKSCEKFEQLKTTRISAEQFVQILSKISADYAKKTQKVYEMSFEESAIQFIDDLTKHLVVNCGPVSELKKK
ncbi:hypothetical protein SAMN05428642_1152 [Flaviramulus basaltis]|uniref:Uncharacterized protein n=1 Tax=Flaviramulus basaltis TaxID=369401 RepID=A0A1K2ISB9_9FLAO|nr:hypothetical protein [Flaviramulus basaltis]SFZ95206.1 hypothetical protein SAMN05428642_1152 [Flaviramulus basaltis]